MDFSFEFTSPDRVIRLFLALRDGCLERATQTIAHLFTDDGDPGLSNDFTLSISLSSLSLS